MQRQRVFALGRHRLRIHNRPTCQERYCNDAHPAYRFLPEHTTFLTTAPLPPRPASRRHLPAPLQLLFRTLNRDLCLPNANEDDIAPRLRDKLIAILRAATHSSVYIGQCMQ